MSRSPFRPTSFAAIALAIGASVAVLAALAAWERSSVSVFEPTPTESLLLLRAGDVVDPSVELGATLFEESAEKRIEGFDRGVLEYAFSAEDTGVEVRSAIVERPNEALAQEELARTREEFGGVAIDPYAGSLFTQSVDPDGPSIPLVSRRGNRFLFVAARGRYVYVVEMTNDFTSEVAVAGAMWSKMRSLDRPGAVLPLRAPLMATQ